MLGLTYVCVSSTGFAGTPGLLSAAPKGLGGALRAATIHVFTHSALIIHPLVSTPCFGGFQKYAGNQPCVDVLLCVSLWGLCKPYLNTAKLPLAPSAALVQQKEGRDCHTSNWPWAFGLWLVEGPAGPFELDVQPCLHHQRAGREVSPHAVVPGAFYHGKAFLSSSR